MPDSPSSGPGISRRAVLAGLAGVAVAGAAPAAATPAVEWVGAGDFAHVYDPTPPGGPARYLNDHTVIQGPDGTWHLFGITGDAAPPGSFPDGSKEINFAHATAPALAGPWTTQPYALTVDPGYYGEVHLWAPHVIESGGTYYMFYAAGGSSGAAINLATSTDLFHWTRLPSGPLFRGLVARDPCVVRVGNQWVMYYCELANWGGNHIVAYRTSTDLVTWSAPGTAFTDPALDTDSASVTESPFVVSHGGWWYLFIGPRNGYVGTDVFRSQDPTSFAVSGWAGHVPAHAAEVVTDGAGWWVTGAGSLQQGVYLAPLSWQPAAPPWQSPDNPVAALDVQGRLTVFALAAADRSIIVRQQTDPATDSWGDWQPFGPAAGAVPTLGRNADGRLEVFALGPAGAYLAHREQNADGSWAGWDTGFGGPAGAAPAVSRNADGRLEVFALGPAGAYLAHRWQNAPSGGWSDWDTGFGPTPCAGTPTVARDPRGLLEVFSTAPVGVAVNLRPQQVPSGGWAGWQGFSGWSGGPPAVAVNDDGRLEAFLAPPGGARVTHRWQDDPTGGQWHAEEVFGTDRVAATPSVAVDGTGRIHVFAVLPDGTPRTRVQAVPSGGWNPWQDFGTTPVAVVPTGSPT